MSQITFGSCEVVEFNPLFLHLNLSQRSSGKRQSQRSECAAEKKSILKTGRTQSSEDCEVPLEPGVRSLHQDFFYRNFRIEDKEGILDRLQETMPKKNDALEGFEVGDNGSGDPVYTPCSQKKTCNVLEAQLEGIECEDGFRSYDAMFDFNNDDYYVEDGEIMCVDYDFA